MESPASLRVIEECVSSGNFFEARRQLAARHDADQATEPLKVIDAELQLELGSLFGARRLAEEISRTPTLNKSHLARAHRVLARCCFHTGHIDESRTHLASARQLCAGARIASNWHVLS